MHHKIMSTHIEIYWIISIANILDNPILEFRAEDDEYSKEYEEKVIPLA